MSKNEKKTRILVAMYMELPNGLLPNDVWHVEVGIAVEAETQLLVVLAHNVIYKE